MKNTSFFTVGLRDLIKGVIVAILTVVVAGVSTSLNAGALPTESELKTIALAGLAAGGAYLIKNLFTNSNDKFLTNEPKKTL